MKKLKQFNKDLKSENFELKKKFKFLEKENFKKFNNYETKDEVHDLYKNMFKNLNLKLQQIEKKK